MKWNDVYIAGIGAYLPPALLVRDALASGELTQKRLDTAPAYESVLVSDGPAGPEMAVLAARDAIAQAGIPAEDYGRAYFSCDWYEGRSMWASASFVTANALSVSVPSIDVRQRCNGGMATFELGCGHVASGIAGTSALLTNGDRYRLPAIDRWATHGKAFYGDSGTAMVLSAEGGFAKVLSTATLADNFFEGMARGDGPLFECPQSPEVPISLGDRYQEFMVGKEPMDNYQRIFGVIQSARDAALRDAGVKMGDIRRVADTATHGGMTEEIFVHVYGYLTEQSTWDFGRTTGHLGVADQFAGLHHLLTAGQVAPGDLVMLLGGGAGFTCTVSVVEILTIPAFA